MNSRPVPSLTVYFDGACPVCAREISLYRRLRGADAVCWVDLANRGAVIAPDLLHDEALARLHVRTADGALVSGAAAFTAMWRAMSGTAWLGRLLDNRPCLWLLELGYRGFLQLRRTWHRAA